MAPLKFRAWRTDNDTWYACGPFTLEETCGWEDWPRSCRFDELIVMQSTGLFDAKGEEIFESDLVADSEGGYDPVVWENAGWFWGELPLGDFSSKQLQIIGNIYESPDLLPSK